MDSLKTIDDYRNDEGLSTKQGHKNLEEIMGELNKLGSPVMTLEQAERDI